MVWKELPHKPGIIYAARRYYTYNCYGGGELGGLIQRCLPPERNYTPVNSYIFSCDYYSTYYHTTIVAADGRRAGKPVPATWPTAPLKQLVRDVFAEALGWEAVYVVPRPELRFTTVLMVPLQNSITLLDDIMAVEKLTLNRFNYGLV